MLIRTFLALPMPFSDKLKFELEELKRTLSNEKIRWIKENDAHLTLAFLGDTSPEQLAEIKFHTQEILKRFTSFPITVKSIGHFGRGAKPEVLWAGIEAPETLFQLQKTLANAYESIGFKLDDRKYNPHLTLGYVKSWSEAINMPEIELKCKENTYSEVYTTKIQLYRSELMSSGVKYSVLDTFDML